MKKSLLMFTVLGLVLSGTFFMSSAQAHGCHGGACPMKGHGKAHGEAKGCPIVEKFFAKAHYLIESQQEIGLTEQQVSDIKALKLEMKKSIIRHMADNQIFALDLKQKLSEPKIDQAVLGALIDKQSTAMAAGAKEAVASYAKLLAILTPEQTKKIKDIWFEHEAKEHGQ